MIVNDYSDNNYARACQSIFDNADQLSAEETYRKLYAAGSKYFPDPTRGPRNLMLAHVFDDIFFDELNLEGSSDSMLSLQRCRIIVQDYLNANFYPTHYILSGSYGDRKRGYAWTVQVGSGTFMVESGNSEISMRLQKLAISQRIADDAAAALNEFQRSLPEYIGSLILTNSELEEYLN